MSSLHTAILGIFVAAGVLSGCSKDEPIPLNASECAQMKEKQQKMMLAEIKQEYQTGLEGAKVEVQIDCNNLDKHARMNYECTMSSDTMEEFGKCQAENYSP
ncbi:hypothetical protein C7S18_06335 [Ahniella affigens]|uniref:Uncharacterized protein n=1 Tax=Ahniella affigens TaxID=2021234 RepID=A0A2P1PPR8_9GAMM|nr:hypothetical protein [Ahniella affigens]AVP96841.1 hypothetical protein C7S18_06335 [Ahniella affigens]